SIHVEHPRLMICGLIGVAIRAMSAEGIAHWASIPAITAERLRTARTEMIQQYSRRAPIFDIAKGEYLYVRNSMPEAEIVDYLLPTQTGTTLSPKAVQYGKRTFLWRFGEPELGMRLTRQMLVNNMAEFDKPGKLQRHGTVVEKGTTPQSSVEYLIFDDDPVVD